MEEYKVVSPWIGVAGYSVAAGTGFFRMYNKRHWFTDVITGGGNRILSTKLLIGLSLTLKSLLRKEESWP
jgi:membrane-associated phospholipid phosphatase